MLSLMYSYQWSPFYLAPFDNLDFESTENKGCGRTNTEEIHLLSSLPIKVHMSRFGLCSITITGMFVFLPGLVLHIGWTSCTEA